MRSVLGLAAILALGIPAHAQQSQQQQQGQPHVAPEPIPTNPDDWHVRAEPIPTIFGPTRGGPLPNWPPFPNDSDLGWHAYTLVLGPCAIFEPAGKKYRYFEGRLPNGIKRKKKFTDAELQDIQKKGGAFKILNRGSSKSEINAALDACVESTARRLPQP
jgi:hypothetical protein